MGTTLRVDHLHRTPRLQPTSKSRYRTPGGRLDSPRRVDLSSPGLGLLVLANGGLLNPRQLDKDHYRSNPSQSAVSRPGTDQDVFWNHAVAFNARGLGGKTHLGAYHLHKPAAICGAPDQGHIGGDNCWKLSQSVTFTVFSAPLALSIGVLAGITGVIKAVQGYMLIDVRSPDYLNTQAVYWIWSIAEPKVTIVSASIPVLRGFIRNVRTRTDSTPRASTYLKTGDNSTGRFYNRTVTAGRAHPEDQDGASDSSILGRSPQDRDGGSGGGIT
ncbi:uncharacterized protein NECHADRAFT_88658 [Fusarium vanettenii 77-13-4]|uniref:Uncharacterized protein n=1 Tax=Fusarium vanettenii (strain ATCC MYA-4622 / CBS 123669 / FGSC 9596 / NRRL 45880 / 77-13-4) TaxID=660122 RepID=C7ZBT2_FUSV7|nr:uncharacterized protein NECHADRAFT_88658 [Fusarium vanettenii 77-13-4]EEU38528.1 hypothetical protein NECHADRAFT_88658 [Fusarium vanettenii 77-13-4]